MNLGSLKVTTPTDREVAMASSSPPWRAGSHRATTSWRSCWPRLWPEGDMTTPHTTASAHPRRLGRSTAAVLLGFVAVAVLSLGTDEVLHVLRVFPPWGE